MYSKYCIQNIVFKCRNKTNIIILVLFYFIVYLYMTTAKYKLVLKPDTTDPGTGLRTLNDIYPQPIVTASGDIDMSGNHILIKRTEVGTQEFTTNGEKGIINVFSDSSNANVSCINFKHGTSNISDNNRNYCSFQSDNTSGIIGSIRGNSKQVSFNSISDLNEVSYEFIKSSYNFFSLIIFCEVDLFCQKLLSSIF